jgi:nucleoprotein TPR
MLGRQLEQVQAELTSKSEQFFAQKRELNARVFDLEQAIKEKEETTLSAEQRLGRAQAEKAETKRKLDEATSTLEQLRNELLLTEERHRQEMETKSKLVELYRKSHEDSRSRVGELTGTVTELQKLLHAEQANKESEQAQNLRRIEELEATLRSLEETNTNLEKELFNANELHANLGLGAAGKRADLQQSMIPPTVAAASALISEGMSLTQMYDKLVDTTEQLQREKVQVRRLEAFLNEIVSEIEQRAPNLTQQKLVNEQLERANLQLRASLEELTQENTRLNELALTAQRRAAYAEKEHQRLDSDIADLSRQIQLLLQENVVLRGGRVADTAEASPKLGTPMSHREVIDQHLVTFKSLQELQEQNLQLRRVVKELGEQREAEEQNQRAAADAQLQRELEHALEELTEMRLARQRQAEVVDAIVRQRDMFKSLYQEAMVASGKDPQAASMIIMSATSPAGAERQLLQQQLQSQQQPLQSPLLQQTTPQRAASAGTPGVQMNHIMLQELQASFEAYRAERAANDKLLAQEMDEAKTMVSNLRVEKAQITAKYQLNREARRKKIRRK